MYDKTKYIYVGLDLHKEQHTAVIMGCFNEKLGEITFEKGIAFEGVVFFEGNGTAWKNMRVQTRCQGWYSGHTC